MVALAAFAVGCNQTGTPVEYSKACDLENEKKYIEVSGYLSDKGGIFCSNTGGGPMRCGLKLLETPTSEKGFTADLEQGNWANNIEQVPKNYKSENIKIRDNNSEYISMDQKVKLVGRMNVAKSPDGKADVCYLTVTKIEKQ